MIIFIHKPLDRKLQSFKMILSACQSFSRRPYCKIGPNGQVEFEASKSINLQKLSFANWQTPKLTECGDF